MGNGTMLWWSITYDGFHEGQIIAGDFAIWNLLMGKKDYDFGMRRLNGACLSIFHQVFPIKTQIGEPFISAKFIGEFLSACRKPFKWSSGNITQ